MLRRLAAFPGGCDRALPVRETEKPAGGEKRRKKTEKRLEKGGIGHIYAVTMSGCRKAPKVGAGRRPVRMSPVPVQKE